MIKIAEHIKINPLTIFVFAFTAVFHYPLIFYVTYSVMALHEAAHLIAAVCIGLRVDYILLQPFGFNLRLKNKMVPSLAEEIILYMSGPFVNAAAALSSAIAYKYWGNDTLRLLYISNLFLFTANLLPAMPLDGGVVARRVMTSIFGFKTAARVSMIISAVICISLTVLGIYAVMQNTRNFSVILFALLLFGNLFTQREKYGADYIAGEVITRMGREM